MEEYAKYCYINPIEQISVLGWRDDFSNLHAELAMCPDFRVRLDAPGERLLSHL